MSSSTPVSAEPERPANLLGLDRNGIAGAHPRLARPAYRAASLYRWIYHRREADFRRMSDLPAPLRHELALRLRIGWPLVDAVAVSRDGTHKYLLALDDGLRVEAVYIPQPSGRITLCLSSQVGCALGCRFCRTARMGFVRNLTPGEIIGQALRLEERHGLRPPYNVVLMGMGEPLLNLDAVLVAFRILCDPEGMGLSARRISVSTAGYVPGIRRLATERLRPRLAVSLNATTDAARSDLMPVNRRYPLAELLQACREFAAGSRERVTFEYVVLQGLNDGAAELRRLARLLAPLRCKVNLIPFNPIGDQDFHQPQARDLERMRRALVALGVPASVRWSKGADIGAACGQLWWEHKQAPEGST
ncbi:MAG: 23S rRNA (adenine(2503)-C(2))-methyltransferase RlmN [Acidobacteriota bacterium]